MALGDFVPAPFQGGKMIPTQMGPVNSTAAPQALIDAYSAGRLPEFYALNPHLNPANAAFGTNAPITPLSNTGIENVQQALAPNAGGGGGAAAQVPNWQFHPNPTPNAIGPAQQFEQLSSGPTAIGELNPMGASGGIPMGPVPARPMPAANIPQLNAGAQPMGEIGPATAFEMGPKAAYPMGAASPASPLQAQAGQTTFTPTAQGAQLPPHANTIPEEAVTAAKLPNTAASEPFATPGFQGAQNTAESVGNLYGATGAGAAAGETVAGNIAANGGTFAPGIGSLETGLHFGRNVAAPSEAFLGQTFKSPEAFIAAANKADVGLPGAANFYKPKGASSILDAALPESATEGFTGAEGLAALEGQGAGAAVTAGGARGLVGALGPAATIASAPFVGAPIANAIGGKEGQQNPNSTRGLLGDIGGSAGVGALAGAGGGALIGGIGALPGAAIGAIGGAITGGIAHFTGHGLTGGGGDQGQGQQGMTFENATQAAGKLDTVIQDAGLNADNSNFVRKSFQTAVDSGQDFNQAYKSATDAVQNYMGQENTEKKTDSTLRNQALALQALNSQVMSPIQQQIQSNNSRFQAAFDSIIPLMPSNMQGIMKQGIADQIAGNNTLATAYAQQALATPEIQKAAFDRQQQIASAEYQRQLQQQQNPTSYVPATYNPSLAPVPNFPGQG